MSATGPDGRPDCGYCAERLRVNVGLVEENAELKRRLASPERDAEERARRSEDALRYILGADIAGYEGHMRPEEVARKALAEEWRSRDVAVSGEGDDAR